jgi:hypothetical protein
VSRERWLLVAGSVGSVIGDILLAILAAKPTGLYLLPWIITGTVMVGVKIGFELYEERMAAKSGRPSVRVRTVHGSGNIIRGRRQGANADPDDIGFEVLFYSFFFALCLAVLGTVIMFSRIGLHGRAAVGLGLPLALIGWTILALFYRFGYGIRAYLEVDADGVTFKGSRGGRTLRERLFIRWADVIDFTIAEAENTGGPWLAAIPPPGSSLVFHGPTSRLYDTENNLILICNLDDVGIQKHVVTGALNRWRTAKTSKFSQ